MIALIITLICTFDFYWKCLHLKYTKWKKFLLKFSIIIWFTVSKIHGFLIKYNRFKFTDNWILQIFKPADQKGSIKSHQLNMTLHMSCIPPIDSYFFFKPIYIIHELDFGLSIYFVNKRICIIIYMRVKLYTLTDIQWIIYRVNQTKDKTYTNNKCVNNMNILDEVMVIALKNAIIKA